jgi:hypothetical protein
MLDAERLKALMDLAHQASARREDQDAQTSSRSTERDSRNLMRLAAARRKLANDAALTGMEGLGDLGKSLALVGPQHVAECRQRVEEAGEGKNGSLPTRVCI